MTKRQAWAVFFYFIWKRAAGRRNELEARLKATIEAHDEFLDLLAHELRTPAGVIQVYAEMMARPDTPDSERKRAQDVILRNSNSQFRIIEDLFDHGSLELLD